MLTAKYRREHWGKAGPTSWCWGLLGILAVGCGASSYAITPQDHSRANLLGGASEIPGTTLPDGQPVVLRTDRLILRDPQPLPDGRLRITPHRPAEALVAGSIVGGVGLALVGAGFGAIYGLMPAFCPPNRRPMLEDVCGLGPLFIGGLIELSAIPHLLTSTALLSVAAARYSPEKSPPTGL